MRDGLDTVAALPVGKGYAQLSAGVFKPWESDWNAFAKVEAGFHVAEPLSVFAFGMVDRWGAQAGVGAKVTF